MLFSILKQVGIASSDCHFTNVFNIAPWPRAELEHFTGPRTQSISGMPAILPKKFVRAEFEPELHRLHRELALVQPNLIIALGAAPCWALLEKPGIKKVRGAPTLSVRGMKVLATYSPGTIFRQYKLHPIFAADLHKAATEYSFPELRRPERFIHVEPTLKDLFLFEREFIARASYLSVDVETANNQITCLGIAPSVDRAIVIPFTDDTKASHNYWPDLETEVAVWDWVRRILGSKSYRLVGQNFNYDMKFIFQSYGIPLPGATDDIMLLHHALQPELEKSLGFMGSLYTKDLSWKFMRPKHTVKKED
jgi:uracil-DNA glycosylase